MYKVYLLFPSTQRL